jgi:hypothetical protein
MSRCPGSAAEGIRGCGRRVFSSKSGILFSKKRHPRLGAKGQGVGTELGVRDS